MNKETAQRLFNYMSEEHGVTLLETDMQEIERILCLETMEEVTNEPFTPLKPWNPVQPTPLKGWVNVYEFNEELYAGAVHDTILSSKQSRHENCIACIDLSKHYEGEGL